MQKTTKSVSPTSGPLKQLENLLDLYLGQKAPALPQNIKDMIVNFAPWLIIIAIIFVSPVIFAAFGIGAFLAPFSIFLLFLAASLILEIIAIPGLFKKTARSWRLVFYATLINAIYSLSQGNIAGLIIGTGLSLYVLFQVKKSYTN